MKFTKEEYNKWNYDVDFQLKQIEKDTYLIQFIKNPSEQVCLKAVKKNGLSIQFINNPSEQMCSEAVKQNKHAFKYIKNPSERMCLEALANNLESIKHINIEKHPFVYEKYELMYELRYK